MGQKLNRRDFIAAAGAGAASVVGIQSASGATAESKRLDELTCDDFAPLKGRKLQVRSSDTWHTVVLRQVTDHSRLCKLAHMPLPRSGREPFSLLLRAKKSVNMEAGICHVQHPEHGPLNLYVTPVYDSARWAYFEIIFN